MGQPDIRVASDESRGARAVENVEKALERLDAVNKLAPELNALITLNPAIQEQARSLASRTASEERNPLEGEVVILKDNIDTSDLATTAGSFALDLTPPLRDADLVTRLRQAGMLVLAKANLSEWSHFRSNRAPGGWSARGGLGQNPFALDRTPGGSSSGSAAAVAAGIVDYSIGTETDASIIWPASVNGIVGLKPTVQRVSQRGVVPISHSLDAAGPLTRTVEGAARLLDVISCTARNEQGTSDAPFVDSCDVTAARRLRVGLLSNAYWADFPGLDALVDGVIRALGQCSVAVVDDVAVPNLAKLGESKDQRLVELSDFREDIAAYLGARGTEGPKSLEDLIRFNNENADSELRYFGQELWYEALEAPSTSTQEYQRALERCRQLGGVDGIDLALRESASDALLVPAFGLAIRSNINGGRLSRANWAADPLTAVSTAGYPVMSVPIGLVYGLPAGILIIGTAWSERHLITLGHAIEQTLGLDLRPQFNPTIEDGAPDQVRDASE
jgi:amidase